MQKLKKILKISGFTFLALALAFALFPFVFKDRIIKAVKNAINDNLEAQVEFTNVDLSVWKSFPDINISIHDLSITGVDTFENLKLLTTDRLDLDFSFWSIVGKDVTPSLTYVGVENPQINILILNDSLANYMIAKSVNDSSGSDFKLVLDGYSIRNGTLNFRDRTRDMAIILKDFNHSGTGDFTKKVFNLLTTTEVKETDFTFGGTKYLNKINVNANVELQADMTQNRYTLKKNEIKLNELDVKFDGYTQLNEENIELDFTFSTVNESFRNFLSIIPNAYTNDFQQVRTDGKASISGILKGNYSSKPKVLPGFDIKIKVNDGFVQYPGLPETISEINADMRVKAQHPDYKDLHIDIPVFKLKIGNDFLDGNLAVNNLLTDGKVTGKLHAMANLANLKRAVPFPPENTIDGMLDVNLAFDAGLKDINDEKYDAIVFNGKAVGTAIRIKSGNNPAIIIPVFKAEASPKLLSFDVKHMKAGKSDLDISGSVVNPLALFSTEKATTTQLSAISTLLDLNEWLGDNPVSNNNNPMDEPSNVDNELLAKAKFIVKGKATKILFKDMVLTDIEVDGNLAANHMDVHNLSGSIEESDFRIQGFLTNAYNYVINGEMLTGNISFKSNKFDLNRFMTGNKANKSGQMESIIPVPANIRLNAQAEIAEMKYTDLNLKNFRGSLEIKNCEVAMKNVTTDIFGGRIAMEGLYNTEDLSNPGFAFKLDVSKLKYADAFSHLHTFAGLAPVAKYIDGVFNTTLIMQGRIGSNMLPDLSTLSASGFIETLQGTLKAIKPLETLSEKLGLNQLKEMDLNNTRNWFEIKNGYLEIKPFSRKIGEIEMVFEGRHGIGKEMDYSILMDIPRELLQKSNILSKADIGLTFIEKEAAKRGLNLEQGSHIHLNIRLKGMLNNPGVSIIPLASTGKSLSQTAADAVKDKIEDVKGEVLSELKEEEARLRDTITKRVESEVEKVRSKAEEATEKAIENVTSKATDIVTQQIDSLAKNAVKDSLSQKAKDVLGEKAGQEVKKIEDKLKDFNPFKKKGG